MVRVADRSRPQVFQVLLPSPFKTLQLFAELAVESLKGQEDPGQLLVAIQEPSDVLPEILPREHCQHLATETASLFTVGRATVPRLAMPAAFHVMTVPD